MVVVDVVGGSTSISRDFDARPDSVSVNIYHVIVLQGNY